MKVHEAIAATAVSVATVAVAVVVFIAGRQPAANKPDTRLREYCTTVSVALDMDADALASEDPQRRLEAAERFGNLVTYHSVQEIQLCTQGPPIDLRARDLCWISRDYACLAKLARGAAIGTRPK